MNEKSDLAIVIAQKSNVGLVLFLIGAIILVAGAIASIIGGLGESGYIRCIANSGTACTSSGSTEYITVFLANSELLAVGTSVTLIGVVLVLGGLLLRYMNRFELEVRTSLSSKVACPKCGTQVSSAMRFCPACGTSLTT